MKAPAIRHQPEGHRTGRPPRVADSVLLARLPLTTQQAAQLLQVGRAAAWRRLQVLLLEGQVYRVMVRGKGGAGTDRWHRGIDEWEELSWDDETI